MRLSAHSLRLAVSLLLGAVFVAPPMASTAFASNADKLLTSDPVAPVHNTSEKCSALLPETSPYIYVMISPARFERVDKTIPNAVVITQPNSSQAYSLAPSKTVLVKANSNETKVEEVVQVTPTPFLPASPAAVQGVSESAPVDSPTPTGSVLNAEVLFNLVNSYRAQVGLPPFEKDSWICAVANSRAPELDSEIWVTHSMHAGFRARNLPFWATENMISMRTEQEALTWWLNSPVHRAAILGNYKYACVACGGKSCAMIFSNLEPKSTVPPTQPPVTPVTQ